MDARLSPDVDGRVTPDRAVWTKPLAFAADAGDDYGLNRESAWRGGVRGGDAGPFEVVKTSRTGGDRMFADAVCAVRAHLRCPRG
jgi:hypothetical protein